ncbi:MAG: hypothetical protein ACC631_02115 [Halocynthiibacter sp.]
MIAAVSGNNTAAIAPFTGGLGMPKLHACPALAKNLAHGLTLFFCKNAFDCS